MVLEATMLVLDNSEWMRNGDYTPSRWEAQADAVNILFDAKTNSNPENMVGLMTMAGKSPEVLVTLTQDIGKVLSALHESKIAGNADIATGINVAQLALKHRQNKMQRQRIIFFVGSPVADSSEGLVRLGKKLKKNNVAVDVVNFGEDVENEQKLTQFVESVNNSDNSHLLTIPAGPQLLSDVILTSPILQEDGDIGASGAGGAGGSGGGGGFEFGVDPSMDPELAMALRMSLEEEQARQRAAEGGSTNASGNATASSGGAAALPSVPEATSSGASLPSAGSLVMAGADSLTGTGAAADDDSEEAMLQQALALSQNTAAAPADDDVQMSDASITPSGAQDSGRAVVAGADGDDDEEMTEEEAIARAIEMSLQENQDGEKK